MDDYRACATSAVREAKNSLILLDYIEKRTGVHIEVLSNSDSVFWTTSPLHPGKMSSIRLFKKGTAIIDVGEGVCSSPCSTRTVW